MPTGFIYQTIGSIYLSAFEKAYNLISLSSLTESRAMANQAIAMNKVNSTPLIEYDKYVVLDTASVKNFLTHSSIVEEFGE